MMSIRMMLGAVMLATGAAVGLSSQAGSTEPMYFYYFYSDAGKTELVGFRRDICTTTWPGGAGYPPSGYITAGPVTGYVTTYVETEIIGQCPGELF